MKLVTRSRLKEEKEFITLRKEIERIEQIINAHVKIAIKENKEKSEYRGIYISEAEIKYMTKRPFGTPVWKPTTTESQQPSESAYQRKVALKKSEKVNYGEMTGLFKLATIFNLSDIEIDILLLCLAPELDLKYGKIYAYLHDDMSRYHPSVDLILNLLCNTFDQKLRARKRLETDSPLLTYQLVHLFDDSHSAYTPHLRKNVRIDRKILVYLLGEKSIDRKIQSYVDLLVPKKTLDDVILPIEIKRKVNRLQLQLTRKNERLTIHLVGSYGVGKKSIAGALIKDLGRNMLHVDGNLLVKKENGRLDELIRLIDREAALHNAIQYWDNFDCLLLEKNKSILDLLLEYFNQLEVGVFLSGKEFWEPPADRHRKTIITLRIPKPRYKERIKLWRNVIRNSDTANKDIDIVDLSSKYSFSGGQIKDIAKTARDRSLLLNSNRPDINFQLLNDSCHAHSNHNLAALAQKIHPQFTWSDIVLPNEKLKQLKEILNHVKYKQKVYVDWGFEKRMSLGKGLTVLFSGASGTGKTMAAEILAGELGLDIYKIDLSMVVSKYIGETEKNLSKIFKEAESSNAILFFDEADALFGKRSEVKDAHDRYANIEIAYLLQKMEEYEGITILASNLRKNLDEAFVRRIKFIIEFPVPDEYHRRRIFQVHLPDEAPVGDDLDLEFLAENFKLTGGNIKNTILHAAFISASEDSLIRMRHFIYGVQREFQKSGKVCVKKDFGKYFDLLSEHFTR